MGDPSKKVKSFKCGGVGHIAEDSRLVTQLGAGLAKPASHSERVEEVVAGLFLTRLEKHPELKSSLSSMSGLLVRPLRASGNRRMSTIGVDSVAAARVLQSCQFQEYPCQVLAPSTPACFPPEEYQKEHVPQESGPIHLSS